MRLPAKPALAAGLAVAVLAGGTGVAIYLAATREVAARGGVLHEGLVVDGPLALLPPFAETQNSRDVGALLFRGLTRTGPDGRPQPELASSWDADPHAQTFTFHLRNGLRWSDGAPLTSADAIYTLSVLQSEQLAQTAAGQAWSKVKATAPDAITITYTLPVPSASFLTVASAGLIPEHVLKHRQPGELRNVIDPPTSGPFAIDGFERDLLRLRRNPNAFEQPYLDGVHLRLYLSEPDAVQDLMTGQIDALAGLLPQDAERLSRLPNRTVTRLGSFAYVQLLFNQKQPALADPELRKAISLTVDRGRMITTALKGFARPDTTPIPPTLTWVSDPGPPIAVDAAAAARALDGSGWKAVSKGATRAKDAKPLSLRLAAVDLDLYHTLTKELQAELGAVGIRLEPSFYSQEKLIGQVLPGGSFDLALTAVDNGPDPDIFVFWHSTEEAAGGFNFSGMPKNVFLDKDLEDGRFNSDEKVRHDAYIDAQKMIARDQPAVFLFSPEMLVGLNNRLKGVAFNPAIGSSQRYQFIQDWYLQTQRVRK
jgi:peptide/nickel transport system substrate-binding protein